MEIKGKAWETLMSVMDFESDSSNFKVQFPVLTKKYGQAYISYCKVAWECNFDVLTEDEFMSMNGNMSKSFFDKVVK